MLKQYYALSTKKFTVLYCELSELKSSRNQSSSTALVKNSDWLLTVSGVICFLQPFQDRLKDGWISKINNGKYLQLQ